MIALIFYIWIMKLTSMRLFGFDVINGNIINNICIKNIIILMYDMRLLNWLWYIDDDLVKHE